MSKVNVLYRNCFYVATKKNDKYYVNNYKWELIDITDKKRMIIPKVMNLVDFSLWYKWIYLTNKK